ncbi:hypothetical protein Tcan_00561, partial [Toxocara canis]
TFRAERHGFQFCLKHGFRETAGDTVGPSLRSIRFRRQNSIGNFLRGITAYVGETSTLFPAMFSSPATKKITCIVGVDNECVLRRECDQKLHMFLSDDKMANASAYTTSR